MRRPPPAARLALIALASVLIATLLTPLTASAAAPRVRLEKLVGGLLSPTQVTTARDGTGRLFVTEQRGTIRIVANRKLQAGFFLDLRSKVAVGGERGLLGLAFHPKFKTNRKLYAFYTRTDGDVVISEFTANSARTRVNPAPERRLVLVEHSAASNHNGGGLAFGPDGFLYAGIGDGGGGGDPEGDARSITRNLLGKVIRIDPSGRGAGPFDAYRIPSSNPYRGAVPGLGEIWARGLRNPWRISFDRSTGSLYIADVGQNLREEVNRQARTAAPGRDYGWNVMEGRSCYDAPTCSLAGDTLPVAEYSHSAGNCSITGGYVYRGQADAALRGRYFFGDFCSGRIWSIPTKGNNLAESLAADTSLNITSFGESESGGLYLVSADGGLYRLRAR